MAVLHHFSGRPVGPAKIIESWLSTVLNPMVGALVSRSVYAHPVLAAELLDEQFIDNYTHLREQYAIFDKLCSDFDEHRIAPQDFLDTLREFRNWLADFRGLPRVPL